MTIPEKMNALVCLGDGFSNTAEGPHVEDFSEYLAFREVDVPSPEEGQALIRVIRATINPSDLHFIKGEYGLPRVAGMPAGFEAVGEVVKVGGKQDGLVGKRVAFLATGSGAWADYAIADLSVCVPVIDQVSDTDAAGMLVNPMTVMAMFEEATRSGNDAFLMTAGASQLGKLLIALASDHDKQAIALVRRAEQIAPLRELGAAEVLDFTADDFQKTLGGLIKSHKPRVLLDAVGDQLSSEVFTAMPARARWIIYGKLSSELPTLTAPGQFIFMNKRIEGFWLSQWMKDAAPQDVFTVVGKVQQRFAEGSWKTDLAETISLSEALDALPAAFSGATTGKVMLTP